MWQKLTVIMGAGAGWDGVTRAEEGGGGVMKG
jgi:hypothetical protein